MGGWAGEGKRKCRGGGEREKGIERVNGRGLACRTVGERGEWEAREEEEGRMEGERVGGGERKEEDGK